MKTVLAAILLFTMMILMGLDTAQAESARDFGAYRVHYSAFNADMLSPEVAKAHDITRSSHRAVLTISVQKSDGNGVYQPAPARVKAKAITLAGQSRGIEMREVRESDAIYYLGEFYIRNEELLDFNVRVKPVDGPREFGLSFRQQFFTD